MLVIIFAIIFIIPTPTTLEVPLLSQGVALWMTWIYKCIQCSAWTADLQSGHLGFPWYNDHVFYLRWTSATYRTATPIPARSTLSLIFQGRGEAWAPDFHSTPISAIIGRLVAGVIKALPPSLWDHAEAISGSGGALKEGPRRILGFVVRPYSCSQRPRRQDPENYNPQQLAKSGERGSLCHVGSRPGRAIS